MDSVGELWRKHPYWIVGGIFVVGLILIYYFLGRRGSSAPDQSGYYAAQAGVAASGNQLAAAQLAAQVAAQGIQASVANQATISAADVSIANIAAQSADTQTKIAADAANANATIAGNVATYTAGIGGNVAINQTNMSERLGERTLQSTDLSNTLQAASTNLANTLAAQVATTNTREASYRAAVDALAGSGASIGGTEIGAMRDVATAAFTSTGSVAPSYLGQSTLEALLAAGTTQYAQLSQAIVNLRPNQ